ncbi:MAG: hypothetical protein ABUS79_02960 [Pseudomonadota bacterium]
MGRLTPRRTPTFTVAFALGMTLMGWGRLARADRNDLQLINLCDMSGGLECPWVIHSAQGSRVDLDADSGATSRYRSLMSELGVVIAPRLQAPADTLGFAGFQFSVELGTTKISHDKSFWNGTQGVDPLNAGARRPDAWLTTMGLFVRKGMWFPFPSLEWGVGAVNVLQSGMWAIQGYVKLALQEGFHDWPLPSAAVRAGFSQLVGTDQVNLTVGSVDVLLSKAFSVAGTFRLEPFAGWNLLFIDARSGVIDGTPGCDAVVLQQTNPADGAAKAALPDSCDANQAGTWGDLGANFTFPKQDIITRTRFYGGLKLRLAILFLVAQVAVSPAGRSTDDGGANLARDGSGTQQSVSMSAGFDF